MKNFTLVMLAVLLVVAISGCNMFRGAGKDVENAGESIQKVGN
jgi:predicted small secreted protein